MKKLKRYENIANLSAAFLQKSLNSSLPVLYTERDKGKTVEVGRAFFETERKHFTILDAPGHKSFVPNKCKCCNLPHNIENCWRKINNLLNKTKRLQKVKQDSRKLSEDREQIMIIGLVSKNNGPIINPEF